jgi:glycosyltransferase involved in cell wall biosynthesis
MSELCVLITNHSLTSAGGSEMYVYDLATRLLERGHVPVVYSPRLGDFAQRLLHATIPVVDDLSQLGRTPDVIHCHHTLASAAALLHFSSVPAVYVCHDWAWHHDTPPRIARIRQWIAVDQTLANRMTLREGRPPGEVIVLPNGVDLARFRRRDPLPKSPRRALVFSNYMTERHVEIVRDACQPFGISVDAVGREVGVPCPRPEQVIGQYDLVFAKGRCAWEALACGTALIVCDIVGVGEMISTPTVQRNVARNFGRRMLRKPLEVTVLKAEIAKYDSVDAGRVCDRVRAIADLDVIVDRLIELYRHAIGEQHQAGATDVQAELREMSRLITYCDRSKDLWRTDYAAGDVTLDTATRSDTSEVKPSLRILREA